LILVELLITIVGRYLATVGLIWLLTLFGHKKKVSYKELIFIGYGGLIRGAIAFGLVLHIDNYKEGAVV
jgi:NhaP-type Na+/H+ or K+/H+ antiporter